MTDDVGIIGIECDYPEYRYRTKELLDILGNKISGKVKENIQQLGVERRHFIKPIEHYLSSSTRKNSSSENNDEPISDLSAQVAKKCLSNLNLKPDDITCLIAASENSDYLSPGLSYILLRKIGISNFTPHFNLQGMACSTFPKVLELGKNLVRDDADNVLIVISGCNSGWYLPHLSENMVVKNPKEIDKTQSNSEIQIKKWVATMFSFLFGDGVIALVLSKIKNGKNTIKIGKITHAVNFEKFDYRRACVRLVSQPPNSLYEYELTAANNVIDLAMSYSTKVLMKSLGKNTDPFDQEEARSYMSHKEKVMIHTGSMKILDRFKDLYGLQNNQIQESYKVLKEYGNLTGCSIPTVMREAFMKNGSGNGKGLLIGITMGFGLDIVEVERMNYTL